MKTKHGSNAANWGFWEGGGKILYEVYKCFEIQIARFGRTIDSCYRWFQVECLKGLRDVKEFEFFVYILHDIIYSNQLLNVDFNFPREVGLRLKRTLISRTQL